MTATVYLRIQDGKDRNGITSSSLCTTIRNTSLASEVYQEFYRRNTFDCRDPRSLPVFFGETRIALMRPSTETDVAGYMSMLTGDFDKTPWIRNLKVTFLCYDGSTAAEQQLESVFGCVNLQNLDITLLATSHAVRSADLLRMIQIADRIRIIAKVCNLIRAKVGDGLKIHVKYHNPDTAERVWLKWEEPDEAVVARCDGGIGSRADNVAVLLASGCISCQAHDRDFARIWQGRYFKMEDSIWKDRTGVWSLVA